MADNNEAMNVIGMKLNEMSKKQDNIISELETTNKKLKESNNYLKIISDGIRVLEILIIASLLAVIAIIWLPTM